LARPLRVLFLCTGNSARSQIAEALLLQKGEGKFHVESAGSKPADRVNPLAVEALREVGIDWKGHKPRSTADLAPGDFDFVITVCDRAKESCPILPGQPIYAHWGMPDPAEVEGTEQQKRRAFVEARTLLARRIDLLTALPMEKMERAALELRLARIPADAAGQT
jgi:arsenate reductase